jgi:hypothetical protein
MKFFTPIFQGVIVLLVIAILGSGIRGYSYIDNFNLRLKTVENQIEKITKKIENVPLCRSN